MILNGAHVYFYGIKVDQENGDRIRQIVSTIKSFSPSAKVSMNISKSSDQFEGLLWGKAGGVQIGVYKRGPSVAQVLDKICDKVKDQSERISETRSGLKTKSFSKIHKY